MGVRTIDLSALLIWNFWIEG